MFDPNRPPPAPGMMQTMGVDPMKQPQRPMPVDPTGGPHQPAIGGRPTFGNGLMDNLPGGFSGGMPDWSQLRDQFPGGGLGGNFGPGGGSGSGWGSGGWGAGMSMDAIREALSGLRSRHGIGGSISPPGPGNLPPNPAVSGPAVPAPNPALGALGGVQQIAPVPNGAYGSQYGVVGATPAASGYGLPTY